MTVYQTLYTEKIEQEIQKTPDEYLPMLLEMVRLFRQSVALKPADESFRQGWKEALKGETLPISELWTNLDSAE
ncbi:MAG: hypothetical protein CVU44_06440 [Chloroflexi bacterium HGW-Chloroflexi-6]|jgi:hypothetical protein|nr:hypothetical protein [Anaerolineae bacterium]PKN94038.1 MAG: hypothetical protein CVU44_06440 [Chloroflexi bacterium HGW-Chloroflexi-6]